MSWSPVLPMGAAFKEGEEGEVEDGDRGGRWSKTPMRGSGWWTSSPRYVVVTCLTLEDGVGGRKGGEMDYYKKKLLIIAITNTIINAIIISIATTFIVTVTFNIAFCYCYYYITHKYKLTHLPTHLLRN